MSIASHIALHVAAEQIGDGACPWAWTIYDESDGRVLVRSRAEYAERDQALNAGREAAMGVRRRLETAAWGSGRSA